MVSREAHLKTCPECNGDGVIEKGTDDEQQCQRAAAVVSCLTTMMMMK
jgi:DnaJ-class molecular chaperone